MRIKSSLFSLSLLLLVCSVALEARNLAKFQAPKPQTIPLKFKPGTSSATVPGSVKGDATKDYKFGASGGQTIKIKLTSKNSGLYFDLRNYSQGMSYCAHFGRDQQTAAKP